MSEGLRRERENIEKGIQGKRSLSLSSIFFYPPSSFSFRGVLTLELNSRCSNFFRVLATTYSLRTDDEKKKRELFFRRTCSANHVVEREAKNDARETRIIEIENLELARHAAFENDGYRLARRERVGEISMHTKFTFFFHPSSSSSSSEEEEEEEDFCFPISRFVQRYLFVYHRCVFLATSSSQS